MFDRDLTAVERLCVEACILVRHYHLLLVLKPVRPKVLLDSDPARYGTDLYHICLLLILLELVFRQEEVVALAGTSYCHVHTIDAEQVLKAVVCRLVG